jgi:hypothetical protein
MHQKKWLNQAHREAAGRMLATGLPALLRHKHDLRQRYYASGKVDGRIIGTGEADFTKGNVEYKFNHAGKEFLLIDVPGIEGDEAKYEDMVECAIAKAHLVFYVNGTGKKPESSTADKIGRYLKHYSNVFAICNVRGKADAYEFDKTSLGDAHKGISEISTQTHKVLSEKIGADNFVGVECVQGLLAFSAVAYDRDGKSTIDRTREMDLVKAQASYRHEFGSIEQMRRFSQIDTIERQITKRFSSFKSDIFGSNQRKLLALVNNSVEQLGGHLDNHEKLSEEIKAEFDQCAQQISKSVDQFATSLINKRNNAMNEYFVDISDAFCGYIREYFDERDGLKRKIEQMSEKKKQVFAETVARINEGEIRDLSANIELAWGRMAENMAKIRFRNTLRMKEIEHMSLHDGINMGDFNAKDFGKAMFNIGSYALSGFVIGTSFPVIGNIVGVVVGAVIGVLSAALSFFGGKDKKIRNAQSEARDKIDIERDKFSCRFSEETDGIIGEVRAQIQAEVLDPISAEKNKFDDVGIVLTRQIAKISQILNSVKEMKYGAV